MMTFEMGTIEVFDTDPVVHHAQLCAEMYHRNCNYSGNL
jgi:hypothetical protein